VVLLLIAIPTFFAVRFGIKYDETADRLDDVQKVIEQYTSASADQDQLVSDLTVLFDRSLDEQIPSFQIQVDNSMSTQLDALYTQINQDIGNQMADVKNDLNAQLSAQNDLLTEDIDSLISEQARIREALAAIKDQADALSKHLNKETDDQTQEILEQINALNTQLSALTEQINNQNPTEGGTP
jgi:chromosome segregation ATPase